MTRNKQVLPGWRGAPAPVLRRLRKPRPGRDDVPGQLFSTQPRWSQTHSKSSEGSLPP